MKTAEKEKRNIDALITSAMIALGQKGPRRKFFERCGKYTLRILGLSVIPVLPMSRPLMAQSSCDCTDPIWCGVSGRFCTSCSGGSCTTCPTGTTRRGSWSKCCGAPHAFITYYDCCAVTPPSCCDSGPECDNGGISTAWCNSGELYCCTVRSGAGPCP